MTLSFLCTIPGLRYLNNHVRYHLFDMPLQPRRRFASFVGASGSGGVDLLDMDNEDLAVAQARGRGAEPGSPHPIVKMTRRKSMLRTVTTTQTVNAGKKQQIPDLRKRHSVANMYTPPPSAPVSHVPSASPSPVPEASNELEICNSERTAVPEIIIEPKTGLMNEKEPIAAPVPMSACVVPQFNSIVEGGGESEDLDARRRRSMDDTTSQEESSVTPTEESLRPWTPISTLSTEDTDDQHTSLHPPYFNPEELSRRRADWVQTMQLFNRDYSPLPPEATQPLESKLSRRLYQTNVPPSGGYSGLEHSKLSRYFSNTSPTTVSSLPTDIPNSSCLTPAMSNPELDSITQQLHDGDLTPPPGFNRRHSSHNASAPRQLGLKQLHRQVEVRMVEEEEEDTVSSPPGYHAAFMNAAERGRRTLFVPSNQSRLVNEVAQSSDQWRWFMGTDNDPVWDPPIRPHSSTDLNRAHLAPVGSGSRSAGRVTPEVLPPKRKNHSNISLGIFDEMFPQ